jgi:hypothetical protein
VQLFIRTHNETLSVTAVRIDNKDGSPVGVNRCDAAPTPTGFAEIVSDDLPLLHRALILNALTESAQTATSRPVCAGWFGFR